MRAVPWKPIAALAGVSAAIHGGELLGIHAPDGLAAQFPTDLGFGQYGNGEDYFNNWDFDGSGNTEWPVDLIFRGSAEPEKVKAQYKVHFGYHDGEEDALGIPGIKCGNSAYEWIYGVNQPGDQGHDYEGQWFSDEDRGVKDACPSFRGQNHFRVYADKYSSESPNEYFNYAMYSPAWGFWTIGVAHRHNQEDCQYDYPYFGGYHHANGDCTGDEWVGQNETAEMMIRDQASQLGWGVYANCSHTHTVSDKNGSYTVGRDDCEYMDNFVYYSQGQYGDTWPYNDGYATHIWVPFYTDTQQGP